MALIINGEPVDEEILEQEFANIKASYEQMSHMVTCCERDDEFRGYARQNVVARVLLTQEARRAVDPVEAPEIDAAVEELKQQHGGEQQFYANVGLTPEQDELIRRDVEVNLRVQKLLDRVVGPDDQPDEQVLRDYHQQHIDRYMNPEKVRVAHLIKNPAKVEEREAAYQQLRQIRNQALDGADFTALARQHTDAGHEWEDEAKKGQEKRDTVDLGFFGRGEMMEEFERMAFSMREGEISPVFTTMFGMHLIQLTGRIPATPKPFEEVREEVANHYLDEQRHEKVRAFIADLESKATIEDTDEAEAEAGT